MLTLLDRGATRQFSMPWEALLWLAELAPFAVLLLRTSSSPQSLAVPSLAWRLGAAACAAGVLASALASPYRGSACLNALPAKLKQAVAHDNLLALLQLKDAAVLSRG